jgi:predicted enzyme related to lactoylglutathione lyase
VRCGGQVVVPKMPIPGVGYLAYCQDTEGLLFGIHQLDPSAK